MAETIRPRQRGVQDHEPGMPVVRLPALRYSTPMDFETLRRGLLALMEHARAEERRLVEGLTEAQREVVGVRGRWSAKDVVAHLAAWRRQAARTLEAASLQMRLPHVDDVDGFNAKVHEEHRSLEWAAVLTEADEAYARLSERVKEATEVELTDAAQYEWRNGLPLWRLVMCDGYEHPLQHLTRFYLQSGDGASAIRAQVRGVQAVSRHFGESEYLSYALYDLACLHLKAGDREDAVYAVRAALRANPALASELSTDPELAPIRSELHAPSRAG